MATTWTRIDRKLDLFLDDALRLGADGEPKSRLFPVPLRVEAWNWAQGVLCYHTPRARTMTLVVEEGKREAVLPPDLFAVEGIYDSDREKWWRPTHFLPGDIRYTDEELPEYWRFGNRLYLEDTIKYASTDLALYYWAYWPDVEYELDDDDNIDYYTQEQVHTPRWAELALCHLTTATCMMPLELFASDINQYKIRVEAGTPLDNPRAQSANFHLLWWNTLIDLFPPARGSAVE